MPSFWDSKEYTFLSSSDYLVGLEEEGRGNGQAKFLRGLQVDHQLEFHGSLDGHIGGLGSVQDLCHQDGGLPIHVGQAGSIGHETTLVRKAGEQRNRWEAMRCGEGGELPAVRIDERRG